MKECMKFLKMIMHSNLTSVLLYTMRTLGIIISSNVKKIPIQIDPNIQVNQCQQYGAQIHSLLDSPIRTSIIFENDMKVLFKIFEKKKKMNIEDDLVYNQ